MIVPFQSFSSMQADSQDNVKLKLNPLWEYILQRKEKIIGENV